MRCDNVISQLLDYSQTGLAQTLDVGLDGRKLNFDLERMQTVLTNLILNASEAMVGRSDTSAKTNGQVPHIRIQSRMSPRGVELIVADNGPGIAQENLEKVMEPLFTTKNFGTGLGLPTVKNILEQHGGGLDIASTAGEGATFTAWFSIENPA